MNLFIWNPWPWPWSASWLDIGDSDLKATKESVRVKIWLCSRWLSRSIIAIRRPTATQKSLKEQKKEKFQQYSVSTTSAFLLFSFRHILFFATLRYSIMISFLIIRGNSAITDYPNMRHQLLPTHWLDLHRCLQRYICSTKPYKILTNSIWTFSTRMNQTHRGAIWRNSEWKSSRWSKHFRSCTQRSGKLYRARSRLYRSRC